MQGKLTTIWKNRKQILEGIKNSIHRDEFVEDVSKHRMEVCNMCPNKDTSGDTCLMPNTQPCCSLCGCSLNFKTRALSSDCPDLKWKAIITEEDEDNLYKFDNNN
jgi:hypothetical protein